jgi:uncharacterized protein DUF6928
MMHSVVDWAAFALWEDTRLVRSLSVSPDTGVIESIGAPLPFGPLGLGEEALRALFGFVYEGERRPGDLDPSGITLVGVWLRPPPPRPRAPRPA